MTVNANAGPLITIGTEAAIGSATALAPGGLGSGPYVSGTNENPDAGPNCFFAGSMLKDMRYRYKQGGGALAVGGYPAQAIGYLGQNPFQTVDLVPSTLAAANIAALQAPTTGTALTLVASSGSGITVETASQVALSTGLTVPAGVLRIDATPGYTAYGASSSVQAWSCAACGRAVSLTSAANLSAINFTVRGYDIYGVPMTETRAGPNANTVNTKKAFAWVASVTPDATSASTVSVGVSDIVGLPIRADKFAQVDIWYNSTALTANTGFVAADTATPSATTGDVRGTFLLPTASDGTKSLQISQRVPPANIATQTGVFGATQYSA